MQEAVRQEKEAEKEAQEQAQDDAEQEIQRQRILKGKDKMAFTTSLASMQKTLLHNVCWALGLPDVDVNVKQMASSIKTHFEAHPELKTSPRFSPLFPSRGKKRPREPDPPPPPSPSPSLPDIPIDPVLIDSSFNSPQYLEEAQSNARKRPCPRWVVLGEKTNQLSS